MNRTIRNVLFVLLGAAVLALVMLLARPPRQTPSVPLPNPNGYDVFVKAGKMITGKVSSYGDLSEPELRTLLLANADALKLARTGLTMECRVPPMDYAADASGSRFDDTSNLMDLGRAFAVEGRLAELENRPGDAATAYLDAVRVGHELGRGGVLIYGLIGIAVEQIGTVNLEKLAANLDAIHCREAARVLEAAEARRESVEAVLQREKAWVRRTFGIKGEITRLFTIKSDQQNEQRVIAKYRTQETRAKSLMIQLAARAYELEHGARPKALADLLPDFLKAIPQDPATGSNMVFTP